MTDNEKAATFVGWEKGRACKIFISGAGNKCICGYELPAMSSWSHEELAPDMSRPENYMKALESLNAGPVPGPTIEGGEGSVSVTFYLFYNLKDAEGKLHAELIEVEKPTYAEAIVATLAALYDAQNK